MSKENMRCHFVPQSYLKRFKNKGTNHLYLLDVTQSNRAKVVVKSPKDIAQIFNWYILPESKKRYGMESDRIENDYPSLFEKHLASALSNLENNSLTALNKATIARFVSFTLHRVPVSREYFANAPKAKSDLPQDQNEIERMEKLFQTLQMHISTYISGETLFPYLMESEWILIKNKNDLEFLTSDNPIITRGHSKTVLNFVEILKALDISKPELRARETGYCVTISPKSVLYINTAAPIPEDNLGVSSSLWDNDRVTQYNDNVVKQSLSSIISNNKTLLKSYERQVQEGEITNSEFIDDPWNDELNIK